MPKGRSLFRVLLPVICAWVLLLGGASPAQSQPTTLSLNFSFNLEENITSNAVQMSISNGRLRVEQQQHSSATRVSWKRQTFVDVVPLAALNLLPAGVEFVQGPGIFRVYIRAQLGAIEWSRRGVDTSGESFVEDATTESERNKKHSVIDIQVPSEQEGTAAAARIVAFLTPHVKGQTSTDEALNLTDWVDESGIGGGKILRIRNNSKTQTVRITSSTLYECVNAIAGSCGETRPGPVILPGYTADVRSVLPSVGGRPLTFKYSFKAEIRK